MIPSLRPCAACPQPEKGRCVGCDSPGVIVPKGTRVLPTDEAMEHEFKSLMARSDKYQPEYLDVILMASRYGTRYLASKSVIEFLQWGAIDA